MSAFMCNDVHTAELAHYLVRHNPNHDLAGVFATLRDANAASVRHRYGNDRDMFSHIDWDFDITQYEPTVVQPTPILKMVHCLEYQSCEPPDWDQQLALELLKEVTRLCEFAGADTSGRAYNDSPWEFCKP